MFRFTIRDLLWLMVVVGIGCIWWGDHKEAKQAKQLREEVKELKWLFANLIELVEEDSRDLVLVNQGIGIIKGGGGGRRFRPMPATIPDDY